MERECIFFWTHINCLEHSFVTRNFHTEQILQLAHSDMDSGSGREPVDQRITEQRRQTAKSQEAHGDLRISTDSWFKQSNYNVSLVCKNLPDVHHT